MYTTGRDGQNNMYGGGVMEKCIVCDEAQKHGIHLYTSFICTDCEKAMINTDPTDPTYKYFINQLKVVTEAKIMS